MLRTVVEIQHVTFAHDVIIRAVIACIMYVYGCYTESDYSI